ncbi:hypothetical protein [Hymenobacter ruricola]|uniref:Zinc-finger domain-containing protein n=1 Tax=Hymenobacter ruricola TaxID=2791023 RepID=A0ABS0I334_9BACT|nr:hypothetical protein [Hymenobacter ruricola]MBF9221348.1 hypothetical protein [Hymenobacter ruricola]
MNTPHLSEQQAQQWAENASSADATLAAHVWACPACQRRVADYQALFSALKTAPQPAFDFNLAARVAGQLPGVTRAFPWAFIALGGLGLAFALAVVASGWAALRQLFQAASAGAVALGTVLAVSVVLAYGLEMLFRHRRQTEIFLSLPRELQHDGAQPV